MGLPIYRAKHLQIVPTASLDTIGIKFTFFVNDSSLS